MSEESRTNLNPNNIKDIENNYNDLKLKYKKLEDDFNSYKINTEINLDIYSIKEKLSTKDLKVLKDLKLNGNLDAYNALLDRIRNTPINYRDLNGNEVNYTPTDGNLKNTYTGDLFEKEIKKIRG